MVGITTKGFAEKRTQLDYLQAAIDSETTSVAIDSMNDLHRITAVYPPLPPYVGMKSYGSMLSVDGRTGEYGKNLHSNVIDYGPRVTGYLESGAPHSIWLRGTPDGSYEGAWMHRPFWPSLKAILDEMLPKIVENTRTRIAAAVKRVMG